MKGKKTVLIFTEAERAITATAVKEIFLGIDPKIIAIIIDVMELRNMALTDFLSNILSVDINLEKIEAKLEKRSAYRNIDKITPLDLSVKSKASYRNMENILLRYIPDLIITIGTGAVVEACAIRKKLDGSFKVVTVVDDYVLNKNLIYELVDLYLVENIAVKTDMVNSYVPESKILISDIPLMKTLNPSIVDIQSVSLLGFENKLPTLLLIIAPNDKEHYKWQIEVLARYSGKYNILIFAYDNEQCVAKFMPKELSIYTDINKLNMLYDASDIILACPYSAILEPAFRKGKLVALSGHNNELEKRTFEFIKNITAPCENEQRLIYFLDKYPREEYEIIRKRGKKIGHKDPADYLKKLI